MMIHSKSLVLTAVSLWCGLLLPSSANTSPPAGNAPGAPPLSMEGLAPKGKSQTGIASRYLDSRTSSGERFSATALTAAHPTLPIGTKVLVTCLRSGRSTIVRINDRGPYIRGRIIDLTPAAAASIGLTKARGIARVTLQPLG